MAGNFNGTYGQNGQYGGFQGNGNGGWQSGYGNWQQPQYAQQPMMNMSGHVEMGMDWVDGEAAARAYQIPPGKQPPIALWDLNDNVIYFKTVNAMGIPNPLSKARYTMEQMPNMSQLPGNQSMLTGAQGNNGGGNGGNGGNNGGGSSGNMSGNDNYVTKSDFEMLRQEIREMRQAQANQNGVSGAQNNASNNGGNNGGSSTGNRGGRNNG